MAFSFGAPKPSLNLGTSTTATNNNTTATGGSIFGNPPATQPQSSNLFGQTTNTNTNTTATTTTTAQPAVNPLTTSTAQPGTSSAPDGPQIDVAHLRSTTKYDHLTAQLRQDILALDTAILNQIRQSAEVGDLLPSVVAAGGQLQPAIDFVGGKLEELETGLENDAEAVVGLRDGDLRRDEGEAKCVFRTVDRLKVPRQYQVGGAEQAGGGGGGGGSGVGFNGALSGWWNQPQTFRGSAMRATAGAGGLSVQLVEEDMDEDAGRGPKNLLDLFAERSREMGELTAQHRRLLGEIEDFVGGLEGKVLGKERELNERLDNSTGNTLDGEAQAMDEREHQMQLLRFVFGEVQKNLYDVAEKIGSTRDGVVDLGLRR